MQTVRSFVGNRLNYVCSIVSRIGGRGATSHCYCSAKHRFEEQQGRDCILIYGRGLLLRSIKVRATAQAERPGSGQGPFVGTD